MTKSRDVQELQKLIRMFENELKEIANTHRSIGKPFVLGEVFSAALNYH